MGELSLDFLKCWWQGEKSTAKREYGGFTKRWFQHQWDVIGIKNKKIQKDRKAMFRRGIRLVQKNTGTELSRLLSTHNLFSQARQDGGVRLVITERKRRKSIRKLRTGKRRKSGRRGRGKKTGKKKGKKKGKQTIKVK